MPWFGMFLLHTDGTKAFVHTVYSASWFCHLSRLMSGMLIRDKYVTSTSNFLAYVSYP